MKIALTGTPGTGKSTVARLVDAGFTVVDINAIIKDTYNLGVDEERDSAIADIEGLSHYVEKLTGDSILEGHVAHLLPVDKIIVLRASPVVLRKRLEARGWTPAKVEENLEAEALDVILVEALEQCDAVYEIDTTEKTPETVAGCIREIIGGTDKYKPGSVDFSEAYFL
ncbi:adenylate kinase family protein [Methanocella sp. MCL-LM]|uniref:adenylate kinase family protein n=1 Tax=Methanocella sp. MCL-LM TaxID=3412035 RepID=UPI003C765D0C